MSPASQGAGLERYIGSCLISSGCYNGVNNNTKQDLHWAGGAPLISMAPQRRPLSRLAVHTQGAPLVLTGRYPSNPPRSSTGNSGGQTAVRTHPNAGGQRLARDPKKNSGGVKPDPAKDGGVSIDSLSIASDESSGSNNSENSLPRIIKPRKRRKKDRKPPPPPPVVVEVKEEPVVQVQPQPPPTTNNHHVYHRNNNSRRPIQQQQHQVDYHHHHHRHHVQVKVLDDNPSHHHQECRYCDSATLVWGPGHVHRFPAVFLPFVCQEQCQLRRSWSDPTSYVLPESSDLVPNRDVGVIGDRGRSTSWREPRGPLEVSTEIVTSPNGHRDLEIKFYSSSSPTSTEESSTCTGGSSEDDEIWRYHESQLQQDFRSLLQAEE